MARRGTPGDGDSADGECGGRVEKLEKSSCMVVRWGALVGVAWSRAMSQLELDASTRAMLLPGHVMRLSVVVIAAYPRLPHCITPGQIN